MTSQTDGVLSHTDMEQHHDHPRHAGEHYHQDMTGDPSLSPDATILVIFLLACLAIGVGTKLIILSLTRWRWVAELYNI